MFIFSLSETRGKFLKVCMDQPTFCVDFQLFDLVYRVICKQVIVLIHVYNFFFRDHFFDSNERARLTKEEECLYHPQPLNKPARGEQPIRIQYGYRNAWDQTFQMMFKFSFIMLQSVSCYLQIWSFTKSQNIKCLIICQEYQYKKKLIVNTQLQTVNVHKNADNYNGPMCGDLNK